MGEVTNEVIVHALETAKTMVTQHKWTLERAVAEATTTEQCRGYQGFQVFAQVRATLAQSQNLPPIAYAKFAQTAAGKAAVAALDKAIKENA